MLRVIVVDDHPLIRVHIVTALTHAADISVVLALDHSTKLIPALRKFPCEIVVLDLFMPGAFDPLNLLREIRHYFPALKILVVSALEAGAYVQEVLAMGVHGYLLKTDDLTLDLPTALRAIMAGELVYSPEIQPVMQPKHQVCETQELAILRLMAVGYENDAIATALGLSDKTIRNLLTSLYRKLDVADHPGMNKRVTALARARALGLLSDAP